MNVLREELGQAPRSSRKYAVNQAVADWLDGGLPGRSERTKEAYKHAAGPMLAKIGHRPPRELTALELRGALESVSGQFTTRTLQIARNSLERAIRRAELIDVPHGKTGRKSKSLTLAQAQELLKAAQGERLYPYVLISPTTHALVPRRGTC